MGAIALPDPLPAKAEFLLRMGDATLVLGHRISEWCGHAPALEEDVALANVALDLIGQTQLWLGYAAEETGAADADALAFRRDVWDFRNPLLVERPNGDFAHTILRSFLFDAWHLPRLDRLTGSADDRVAGIAAKAAKEVAYHLERSRGLVVALGDGTAESHDRMQAALDRLWPYAGELFETDATDAAMAEAGVADEPPALRPAWEATVLPALAAATLAPPEVVRFQAGGRTGRRHTEHLGPMLAQMQWLQRSYPDASAW
ncbi:phenylacetate-CoA oxygenase subunit PaaC [Jannaschia sp. Os4]|uniref:1,2-phenylacetyl-CoA epoxidase subunit PaaC n=1 Tax=Jannaschia sp. Os4 TaxID=2807617 RepID=UPI00193A14A0|nr:1,2-phenylacetyl-CoA epoxidase subunit PaaC [Jannaschia sp. Os4]MBM2576713.1 phenylacetate-CoA oxygenase subunit PaaC [Jannaschia sp. Os4]